MKVGITLPVQHPFDSTEQILPAYEAMGADSYWAPDHFLGIFHPGLWSDIPLSDLAKDPEAFSIRSSTEVGLVRLQKSLTECQ